MAGVRGTPRFWPKRRNGKTISMEPRTHNRRILPVFVVVMFAAVPLTGQQDCLDGIINGSFGINATITLCPKLASQVPGLQNRLTEIAAAQGEQKEQIRELKRLITSLNNVGRNIGEQRQIELLKNFSAQISGQRAAGQKQTQERIADLADQFDDLKTLLIEKLGNAGTRDRTTAAIDGPVGDAIAKFDLAKAHDLLEDIRAQLNVIGGKVDESLKQEKDIKGDTAATRQILEQYQAQVAQNQKQYADMMAARSTDPRLFARVNFVAMKMPSHASLPGVESKSPPWQIQAIIPQTSSLTDPKLQIAFTRGQKSWIMNAEWSGRAWEVNADELGDKAVACLTSQDSKTGNRRQWTQSYTVQPSEQGPIPRANFTPVGDPTLTPDTGAPCGGVTAVREPAKIESIQDQLAEMRQKALSSGAGFGRIEITTTRINGGWWVTVFTAPANFVYTTFYDMKVQMVMKGAGRAWSVPLSNREVVTSGMEKRSAALRDLGTEAVVCFTAKDPSRPEPMRMTKWFSIDASANTAAFVPSREPTLAVASDAPCE
jgi:hypothetical protein